MEINQAVSEQDFAHVRRLLEEYATIPGIGLCTQNFRQELADLPGAYAPPDGRLLLAHDDGVAMGCVALRNLDDGICEMKRLYVQPRYRDRKVGRDLVLAFLEQARQIGYEAIRLDTFPFMRTAIDLYRSLGFEQIEAYKPDPSPELLYLELRL
jgi:ribosomal protein S18 acetylase RimI-like enzyme